ncbi:MAG: TRAP transporter fused permease subunit [Rhodobacteraceae bacterium]|nr:TRAP transporter fused permease subunit [Paracoccaceae bacterium]
MSTAVEQEADLPSGRLLRAISIALGAVVTLLGLAWAADLYRTMGVQFRTEQFLAVVLGLSTALVFLVRPLRRGTPRTRLPWYDALLALAAVAAGIWIAWHYPQLLRGFFRPSTEGLIATWTLFVLLLEALRRSAGWPLVIVVLAFVGYALVGHMVEGSLQTREVRLNRMIYYVSVDTSGILGLVLLIGVTVVIPFVFFGQLLAASGGAAFFNDVSLGLMGRFRGGAAKISVLASSLFGSINGIVVSNILATGVVTIPLMKKSGFRAEKAAAIEAASSNGGQLMPPVMGAVAFLMADFLQISYAEVAIAAIIPSLLYYIALFVQADLEAAKGNILRVPARDIPRLLKVIAQGWAFLLPFAVLIYALFSLGAQPETAALYACATVALIGFALGYGAQRLSLREVWNCIVRTGVSSADILMIAGAAGVIMGVLQLTGLGFALTMFLVSLGAGNILLLLIIAALLCIVLGMGMPTLGVYVLLAVLVAPALVEVGVQPLAAHMFILYLGMMSFVTPPVAIAAFFAANLARGEPMLTGFYAMRFSWTAYIIPFLFVFAPTLLMQGSPSAIVLAIGTAAVGVWFISAGMIGYGLRRMPPLARLVAVAGGAGLLLPHEVGPWAWGVNAAGLVLAAAVLAMEIVHRHRPDNTAAAE